MSEEVIEVAHGRQSKIVVEGRRGEGAARLRWMSVKALTDSRRHHLPNSLGSAAGRAKGIANTPEETVARTEIAATNDLANIFEKKSRWW